jgi:hypothetical protein
MARYIYSEELDKLVSSEEYYFNKYMQKAHLHMTVGNVPVKIHYIADEMNPTRHMCNGKLYTSKKKFRDETRARGCIEYGNESDTLLKPRKSILPSKRQRREDIKRAIWELNNGRKV